jgi:hypothetical protein
MLASAIQINCASRCWMIFASRCRAFRAASVGGVIIVAAARLQSISRPNASPLVVHSRDPPTPPRRVCLPRYCGSFWRAQPEGVRRLELRECSWLLEYAQGSLLRSFDFVRSLKQPLGCAYSEHDTYDSAKLRDIARQNRVKLERCHSFYSEYYINLNKAIKRSSRFIKIRPWCAQITWCSP